MSTTPTGEGSPRIIDYMCSSFLPDRADVWDHALAAQGIPLKIRRNPDDSFCDASTMVARMDELGYESIIVSTSDLHHHGTVMEYDPVANRFAEMQALADAHPGRFYANWAVNPQLGMAGVKRAREVLDQQWVAALWIHTHSFDRRFDHPDYYPYYALASEFGVPVVMQAGASGGLMPSECGVPIGIDRPAIYFRDVDFVLSHTGHPWEAEAINMALKFPNVFLGACAYPPKHWPPALHTFLRGPGRTKVIFGTNFPTVGHRHVLSQLAELDVPAETYANFVQGNARRVFTRLARDEHGTMTADAGTSAPRVVPEPEVKAMLVARGVRVPRGSTDPTAIDALTAPLVVKAFGPTIVHKSDIGAVQLGVAHADVAGVVAAMGARVDAAGFLVEEQCAPGIELIVGVVDRGYGPMVAVGFGGTLTEVLDDVALRCVPVDHQGALAMLDELRGAAILHGTRGKAGIDRDAVAAIVVAVADLAQSLGQACAELECNPVIAYAQGAVAVDARLILRDVTPATGERAPTDFTALFAPRGVAIAGASATKSTFGNRFLAAYRDYGWTDGLYALHPNATEIDGVPAYPTPRDVPGPLDYVIAAVPATGCADLVRSTAGVAPFVHIISGGFSEVAADGKGGRSGKDLEAGLVDAARTTGVRVLGPNCMGAFSPRGRQVFQEDAPRRQGHVSVISQSGGLAGDIVKVGDLRGIAFSKLVTMGNAVDVTPGEICDWLVDDADTNLIGLYIEDPRDGGSLVHALRRARGVKPTVALIGGLSGQGGEAVASHTGSLAGDDRVWQAISAGTGLTVVRTLEDLLGALVMLQRYAHEPSNGERSVLVIGVGGGASVLTTDACDRAGLQVTKVRADIQDELRTMGYGAGTSVANPLEIPFGPVAPLDAFSRVLGPILEHQPYGDVLVHFNVQSYFSFGPGGAAKLLPSVDMVADLRYPGTRITLVPRNVDTAPPELVAAIFQRADERGLPCYRTLDEAAVAIAAVQRFTASR